MPLACRNYVLIDERPCDKPDFRTSALAAFLTPHSPIGTASTWHFDQFPLRANLIRNSNHDLLDGFDTFRSLCAKLQSVSEFREN